MMEKVLSEVYNIVLALGTLFRVRIPDDVWAIIEEQRDKSYNPHVDENKALNEQEMSLDAITFIAMLHRDYWCDSEEEREELLKLLEENEERLNEKLLNSASTRELMKLLRKK